MIHCCSRLFFDTLLPDTLFRPFLGPAYSVYMYSYCFNHFPQTHNYFLDFFTPNIPRYFLDLQTVHVQRLMLSNAAKRTILYHITEFLQYFLDKTIAGSGDMYRDDFGILTLVINVSASQTLRYKISLFEFIC